MMNSVQYLRSAKSLARRARFGAAILLAVTLAACGDAPLTTSTAGSGAAPTRNVILDKATRTILDQALAYPTDSAAEVTAATIRLEPGAETGFHRHDTPLVAYIISGTLTVYYDGDVVKVYTPGTALVEAMGTYHNGRNEGTEPVELLAVSIGAEGLENTTARP